MLMSDWSSDVCSSDLYVGQYANGCISGCGSSRDGGDGGFPQSQYWSDFLIAPIENYAFIGRFDYALADGLNFDFRVDYGRSQYDAYRRPYRDDDRLTWLNGAGGRSEEHKSELQSLMSTSYAVFCLKKKKKTYET